MKIHTKESIIEALTEIRNRGWIENQRHGNHGGVGNTLEDLLGIEENNLPIPNAAEWELKAQRADTTALATLFHMEPSPTALKFVPRILLPTYGWPHQEAGAKYSSQEKSFRQTISAKSYSDRGFTVAVDRAQRKVVIAFNPSKIASHHSDWQKTVAAHPLNPQPYWGFDDLSHKLGTKLHNCFFVQADRKRVAGKEYFHYSKIMKLSKFSGDKFIQLIESGSVYVDFDARTGHNHGTKFRIKPNQISELYAEKVIL